jgi:hypothetical protein
MWPEPEPELGTAGGAQPAASTDVLGAPPAAQAPRAAVKTLADFVLACVDIDSVEDLLEDYSSAEEFAGLLEEYSQLLKDTTKTPGQKQREKLIAEHAAQVQAAAGRGGGSGSEEPQQKSAAQIAVEERRQAKVDQAAIEAAAKAARKQVSSIRPLQLRARGKRRCSHRHYSVPCCCLTHPCAPRCGLLLLLIGGVCMFCTAASWEGSVRCCGEGRAGYSPYVP